jgi:hypothetical protein
MTTRCIVSNPSEPLTACPATLPIGVSRHAKQNRALVHGLRPGLQTARRFALSRRAPCRPRSQSTRDAGPRIIPTYRRCVKFCPRWRRL